MSILKNFIGKFDNGKQITDCFGKIEVLEIDEKRKTAYVSWQIFHEKENSSTGISQNYYFGEAKNPQEKILEMVIVNIEKYKINRQKVFSEIKISE